jgi:hypothetical protein
MTEYVYPFFLDKLITVRDRTGMEYHGVLRFWKPTHITLHSEEEEIVISREQENIVSIRVKRNDHDGKATTRRA